MNDPLNTPHKGKLYTVKTTKDTRDIKLKDIELKSLQDFFMLIKPLGHILENRIYILYLIQDLTNTETSEINLNNRLGFKKLVIHNEYCIYYQAAEIGDTYEPIGKILKNDLLILLVLIQDEDTLTKVINSLNDTTNSKIHLNKGDDFNKFIIDSTNSIKLEMIGEYCSYYETDDNADNYKFLGKILIKDLLIILYNAKKSCVFMIGTISSLVKKLSFSSYSKFDFSVYFNDYNTIHFKSFPHNYIFHYEEQKQINVRSITIPTFMDLRRVGISSDNIKKKFSNGLFSNGRLYNGLWYTKEKAGRPNETTRRPNNVSGNIYLVLLQYNYLYEPNKIGRYIMATWSFHEREALLYKYMNLENPVQPPFVLPEVFANERHVATSMPPYMKVVSEPYVVATREPDALAAAAAADATAAAAREDDARKEATAAYPKTAYPMIVDDNPSILDGGRYKSKKSNKRKKSKKNKKYRTRTRKNRGFKKNKKTKNKNIKKTRR